MRYPLGRRLLAGFLDLIVVAALFVGVGLAFGGAHAGNGSYSVHLNGVPALVFFVAALAYYFVLELLFGRTIGKFLVHIRAVSTDGGRLTLKAALLRNVGRIIDALPLFYLVGLIALCSSSSPRQRVGDRIAGTTVIAG
jgi:uncharacterized RDD family membrane protein YckC